MTRRHQLATLAVALVAIAGLAACAQPVATSTPAPTPTPTATPTPTPAPTPTPPSSATFDLASMPSPDPLWSAGLSHLLSLVPAGYGPAFFLDVEALQENPELQQTLDLEVFGLLKTLPPAATMSLDSLVVATGEGGEGLIMVLNGPIDIESLLQMAGSFGLAPQGLEPESHRGHVIRSIDVFGLTLAVGSADDSTAVMATGSPGGATPALDQVKGALDGFDGLAPRLLDNPEVSRLVTSLPPGVTAVVLTGCTEMAGLVSIAALPGCNGAALSAEVLDQDTGAINAVVGFQDDLQAAGALRLLDKEGIRLGELPPQNGAARQEESLLRIRFAVNLDQIPSAFDTLAPLER